MSREHKELRTYNETKCTVRFDREREHALPGACEPGHVPLMLGVKTYVLQTTLGIESATVQNMDQVG